MHQKTHSYVPNPHATLETPGAATAEPGEEVILYSSYYSTQHCSRMINTPHINSGDDEYIVKIEVTSADESREAVRIIEIGD